MAPIRRYLRITKYSVLEVRIYLDNPTQQQWLLNPRDDVLPRIFQAIRPYVLPKLREENERAKGKGKRPKGVKDTVSQDDFEVSIFLTETSSRHSLLTKQKDFQNKEARIKSNSGKLTGWLEKGTDEALVIIREESDEEGVTGLNDYPEAQGLATSKPSRNGNSTVAVDDDISDDEGFHFQTQRAVPQNKGKEATQDDEDEAEEDDKKKLNLKTAYDGFSIYGRILCLIVKRRGVKNRPVGVADGAGQMMLEDWVSTQAAQEPVVED